MPHEPLRSGTYHVHRKFAGSLLPVLGVETIRRAQVRELAETYARATPVRSIAVVGNKPLAPSADRAAAIDSCDLVIRVNGFRLDDTGDESTYGRRAEVVFFNRALRATPWFFAGYRDRLYLLVEPGRLHWEPDLIPTWWPRDLGQIHIDNEDLTLPLSAEMGLDSVRGGALGHHRHDGGVVGPDDVPGRPATARRLLLRRRPHPDPLGPRVGRRLHRRAPSTGSHGSPS